MQSHRPSPALVVSIIALVVALGGTAVATQRLLITSTSQIKDGAITGKDIRKGTITRSLLSKRLAKSGGLTGSSVGDVTPATGTTAFEAHRQAGPALTNGGKATVATLDLAPGVYAVFSKVNLAPNVTDAGLLNTLLKSNKTILGSCTLDVAGTGDYSAGALVSPGSQNTLTLSTQVTRTLDQAAPATVTCEAEDAPWRAADASIIAIKLDSSTRSEVSG